MSTAMVIGCRSRRMGIVAVLAALDGIMIREESPAMEFCLSNMADPDCKPFALDKNRKDWQQPRRRNNYKAKRRSQR